VRLRRPQVDTDQLNENWQPRLYARLIFLALLIAYAIAFILENRTDVHVHFVFATAEVSLIWVILFSGLLALLGGILLSQLYRRRRRRRAE
jgi:uncharacterized integral membrane protein